MSTFSDRLVMTIIVVTAVLGLAGHVVTSIVSQWSGWYVQYVLPILVAVFVIALVIAVWEGLDLMD